MMSESPWGTPRIASVESPRRQLGITAAEFLAGTLKMGDAPHIKLQPSFVNRSSLGEVISKRATRISTIHL